MRRYIPLICVLLLPLLVLGQRFVRVANDIGELQAQNPFVPHTNVFVSDTNAGGMFVYLADQTNSDLIFYPTLFSGATGIYVRVTPPILLLSTNLYVPATNTSTNIFIGTNNGLTGTLIIGRVPLATATNELGNSMMSQTSTNTLQIGQDADTRLIAFADPPNGISSYELDAGGHVRMVLSAGTTLSDNSFNMFDAVANTLFKVDSGGDIVRIRGATYTWPSTNTTPGYLYNNGAGTLTFTSATNGASVTSWQAVGTGADFAFTIGSGTFEPVTFGTSGPGFVITNAGTYQIHMSIAATAPSSYLHHYWLTNITDTAAVAASYVGMGLPSSSGSFITIPISCQITTTAANKTFQLWGSTEDNTGSVPNNGVVATKTYLNVIKLH